LTKEKASAGRDSSTPPATPKRLLIAAQSARVAGIDLYYLRFWETNR
jgi:hypothetical protein